MSEADKVTLDLGIADVHVPSAGGIKKMRLDTPERAKSAMARLEKGRKSLSPAAYASQKREILAAYKRLGIAGNKPMGGGKGLRMHFNPSTGELRVRHLSDADDGPELSPIENVALADVPEATKGGKVPRVWIQLAQVGEFHGHPAGSFSLSPKTFSDICANFARSGIRYADILDL